MSLRYLRRLLSIMLVAVMALGGTLLIGVQLVKSTACNEAYISRFIDSNKVNSARKESFSKRLDALEAKSGIPSRVFDAVYNYSEITQDTAIHRVFSHFDSTLYNEATIERFEKLCKEYLDGTNTEYDKKLVRATAEEAAKIYSDSFGLRGSQEFISFVERFNESYRLYMSFGFILFMLPVTLIFIMFQKINNIFTHILPGFTATGLTLFLTGILGLIFKIGQTPCISPAVYAAAVSSAVRGIFVIAVLLGAVIFTASLISNIYLVDKAKLE